jgi:exosome complex component RRP45
MAGNAAYIAIRDDAGPKSLSINEREFLRSCALSETNVLRDDGRREADLRKVRLQLGRWDNGAECTVQWGVGTRVTSLCVADLVPPSPDRPNEGMVDFRVELSPMACPAFRQAPASTTAPGGGGIRGPNFADQEQKLLSNRILRCIERIILTGGALDTEALVVLPGKWVWRFTISLTILDHGGNLLDACVLCAMAALRHYRKPHVDLNEQDHQDANHHGKTATPILPTMIPSMVKEATPLPLHHTPLSISFALIPADDAVHSSSSSTLVAALVDPTDREELVQFGSLTVAMNVHSEVCLLDYGGGCELTPAKLKECWKLADVSIKQLCQLLEESLQQADEQAQRERLERLKSQIVQLPPLVENSPFQLLGEDMDIIPESSNNGGDDDTTRVQQAQSEAEEAYRQQALDYSRGHVAQAIKEDDDRKKSSSQQQAGSLLAAMLKSVQQGSTVPSNGSTPASTKKAVVPKRAAVTTPSEPVKTANPPPKATAEKTAKKATESKPVPMDLESDEEEEETTTVLQSEFQAPPKAPAPAPTQASSVNEDDITDLTMAIKSKKKKSKSKKK